MASRRFRPLLILYLKKGLSLVELVVSAGILGFVLSAIMITFVNNVALDQYSRNLTLASSHADAILEGIRGVTFGAICSSINAGNWSSTSLLPSGSTLLKGESIVTSTTTTSGSCPSADFLTITTRINWKDYRQRSQTVNWTTQVGN